MHRGLAMKAAFLLFAVSGLVYARGGAVITDVEVREVGADRDPAATMCSGFTLDGGGVARFFSSARAITRREEHDHYNWAPCYVRGVGKMDRKAVSWEIRAGGTAWVKMPDGSQILFADVAQRYEQDE